MQTFKSLMEFIGTHDTKLNTFDDAKQLFFAAKRYDIPHLEERCLKFIDKILDYSNVCQVYEFAKENNLRMVEIKCENIVCWDTKRVLDNDDFLCARVETVLWIFQMDDLIINNELDLFLALERWVKLHQKVAPPPDINVLETVIRSIRYLTLTPVQFIQHVAVSELLSSDEKLSFLAYLVSSDKSPLPLPGGFSREGERVMEKQDKFIDEFRRLISDDIATSQPATCQDCEEDYCGFYIDHLLFYCPNTSSIDRSKLKYLLFGSDDSGSYELKQDLFEICKRYQKALCRYIRHNFNWIQLNGKTYDFEI